MFLSSAEVDLADRHVNTVRGLPLKSGTHDLESILKQAAAVDIVEAGLPLPKSAYDGCETSYLAADECNIKASASAFAITGLMALVCRHDRVISMANITSPGEKQCYPIALLQKLQKGLPKSWKVGVLYDIGCQMDRSIRKVRLQFPKPF